MVRQENMHFTLIWTVENFSIPCRIKSPSFTVKEIEMTKWHLEVRCESSGPVSFGILREPKDDGPDSVEIKCEFSVLGISGSPLARKVFSGKLESDIWYGGDIYHDIKALFDWRRTDLLLNDSLTFRCRMRRTGTEIRHPEICFAHTLLKADRRIFVWAIREFSTLQQEQRKEFILNLSSTIKLSLNLFIRVNDGKEYVNIDMQITDRENIYSLKVCLLDFEGKVVHSQEKIGRGSEGIELKKIFEKRRLINNTDSFLPNDVLSLICIIKMNAKIVSNVIESYRYQNATNLGMIAADTADVLRGEQDVVVSSSFTQAMKILLEEGISSDVSLQAGSQMFPAHKNILSARSAVFRAMFNTDMIEKKSKCVPVPDITADTMSKLLSYIYTDIVGELEWRGAVDLYRAADKYELLELKKWCTSLMRSSLSEINVCSVLTVADMHHDQELKQKAEDFIIQQGTEFLATDTWRSFKEENTVLALEILERMLCEKKRETGKCVRMF